MADLRLPQLNKVLLVGRITQEPELRFIPSGQAVMDLRLAVNRRYKDKNDAWQDDTCYVTATVWGDQASRLKERVKVGVPVFVEGRLKSRTWEAKDGTKRSALDVQADRVQVLAKAGAEAGEHAAPAGPSDEGTGDVEDSPGKEEVPF